MFIWKYVASPQYKDNDVLMVSLLMPSRCHLQVAEGTPWQGICAPQHSTSVPAQGNQHMDHKLLNGQGSSHEVHEN